MKIVMLAMGGQNAHPTRDLKFLLLWADSPPLVQFIYTYSDLAAWLIIPKIRQGLKSLSHSLSRLKPTVDGYFRPLKRTLAMREWF